VIAVLAYSLRVLELLKYLHILAAMIWIGTSIYFQFQGARLVKADDPPRLAVFAKDTEFAGKRLLMPASAFVLLMGISMVAYSPVYDFSDPWILIGLLGFAATFVTGAFFISPTSGKLATLMETDGPASPDVHAGIRRIFMISRIDLAVLVLVVADMVFKPGLNG
jgi:uncharacterized membrane protein